MRVEWHRLSCIKMQSLKSRMYAMQRMRRLELAAASTVGPSNSQRLHPA